MLDVNDVLLTIVPCHRHNSHMTLYDSLSATHRVLPHQLTDTAERAARYACGPTVCDAAHLGHARTYVAFDILRTCVAVVAPRLKQRGEDPLALARRYERELWKDMERCNVLRPDVGCRVSEHMQTTIWRTSYPRRREDVDRCISMCGQRKAGKWTLYGKLTPVAAASLGFFSWKVEKGFRSGCRHWGRECFCLTKA
ncbi:hypothetical protein ACHAW6_009782 [Cyclotella cf. meneghiniana]